MAEVAGLVISGVGLAALASTVAELFEKVDIGRNLGKDYEHYALQLVLAKLAYQRWQKAVRFTEPSEGNALANVSVASEQETKAVKDLLGEIERAFNDAKTSNQVYEGENEPQLLNGADGSESGNGNKGLADLEARARVVAKKRQKSVSILGKVRWVVHDRKAFQTLTERVSKNVTNLTQMFPAVIGIQQQQLAVSEVTEIAPPGDTSRLDDLVAATKDVDPILHRVATYAKRQGHLYDKATLTENAKALYGDDIAPGAQDPGTRHEYHDVQASGQSKAVYGNRARESDFLKD